MSVRVYVEKRNQYVVTISGTDLERPIFHQDALHVGKQWKV